jgi:polyphosphate glucokinase
MEILGIDIGGSGIKGAPVDTESGQLLAPRCRQPTPSPAKPRPIAAEVAKIVQHFEWRGPVGVGYPGVIRDGATLTAANLHKSWIGLSAEELVAEATGCRPVKFVNDADAAGLAEMSFGAGRGCKGVVLLVTIGTGLGTAIFTDGHLLPNTEFGHMQLDGLEAERFASDAVRKGEKLSWKKWALRFDKFLRAMEDLIWPDLIILGGGISKHHTKYLPFLSVKTEVVPAQMLNEAGIVGTALAAVPAAES